MIDTLDMALRMAGAVAMGSVIGVNRDMSGKPTGVRLHALLALACATIVMSTDELDPDSASRTIQGLVGGIGFLGAGVIMRGEPENVVNSGGAVKKRPEIHNLSTAASIMLTAVLGMVVGLGHWKLCISASILALFILVFGGRFDHKIYKRHHVKDSHPGNG